MKPPHKELVADGNRQKPPRMLKPAPSTTSSDALTALDDIDDDLTTSASESYVQDESSSDEGNRQTHKHTNSHRYTQTERIITNKCNQLNQMSNQIKMFSLKRENERENCLKSKLE